MKNLFPALTLACACVMLFGCRTSKVATTPSGLPSISTAQLIDSVNIHSAYHQLSGKISVKQSTEEETRSFSVRARMQKDSVIWLSITPGMGIELVRVIITPDSIKMLNRMDQKYFLERFDKAQELLQLDIDFRTLQSVMTGQFVPFYNKEDYRMGPLVDLYRLEAENGPIAQQTEVDPGIWRVTRAVLKHKARNEEILAEYSDFEQLSELLFPTTMRFRIQAKQNMAADLSWSRLEHTTGLRFPFNIPSKYEAY